MTAKRGQLQKIEERRKRDKNQLKSSEEAIPLGSFAASLGSASVVVASVTVGARGHLRFTKNSRGSGSEESGTLSGTSG